jgi:hypothetical protein
MSIAEKLTTVAENVPKVYEAGQKSEYDRFWDNFQENGNRTVYGNAFGSIWSGEIFKPKYDIRPTQAYMMFHNNMARYIIIDDFVQLCEDLGIVFDTSNCGNFQYAFSTLGTKRLGVLNLSKATSLNNLFYSNYHIQTIDEIISSESTPYNSTTFEGATSLTNIKFSGVIARDLNFSKNTKLTVASINSAISCLKDLTGTGTTLTLTLGTTNLAKLSDSEKAVATQKGWTLA